MAAVGYLVVLLAAVLGGAAAFLHNLKEGDSCMQRNGAEGVCTGLRRCRGSAGRARMSGNKIQFCSYGHDGPIICCPTTITSPMTLRMMIAPVAADQLGVDVASLFSAESNRSVEIATKKCAEYGEYAYVTKEVETLQVIPEFFRELKCAIIAEELIVGGMRAERNEFAHMAALGYVVQGQVAWKCAGSLISERFVLTAAHCTSDPKGTKVTLVRLGTVNVKHSSIDESPQTITVMERIRHPEFKNPAKYYDIALLKLSKPAKLGLDVRPACLYTAPGNPPGHKYAIATGWGLTNAHHEHNSDVLMKVRLELFPSNKCENTRDLIQLSDGVMDSKMICSGDSNGDKDTCMGDSGGPLQIHLETPTCMYSIIGVTSFGSGDCVSSQQPGVYSRVSHYIPWIQGHVWP